jgi:hypothetical protein
MYANYDYLQSHGLEYKEKMGTQDYFVIQTLLCLRYLKGRISPVN